MQKKTVNNMRKWKKIEMMISNGNSVLMTLQPQIVLSFLDFSWN